MSILSTTNYQIQLRKEIAKAGNFSYVGIPSAKKTVRVEDDFGYWKLVDLDAKPIINKVERLSAFVEGRAIVENGKEYHKCDTYFIDEEGNRITNSPIYPHSSFSEGLAVVSNKKNKFGYINRKGKVVIPCIFDYACEFQGSVAWVKIAHLSPIGSLFYLIDKSGKQILPYPFSAFNQFVDGVAGVKLVENYFDSKMRPTNCYPSYVVIDKQGNYLSNRFFYIEEFCDGLAIASAEDHKQILVNKEGQQISKKAYEGLGFFHEGICSVSVGRKSFYMDKEENQLSAIYDSAKAFSEGLGCVEEKRKFFFIDRNGKEVFSETFDDAKPFCEGVARVQKGRQIFYIDHNAERVF